jgi:hypothetical protein
MVTSFMILPSRPTWFIQIWPYMTREQGKCHMERPVAGKGPGW